MIISATEGRERSVKTVSSAEQVLARIDPTKVNDELIETLIVHLKPSLQVGCTLLVFLPGTASISRLYSRLSSLSIFTKKDRIIKLHSTASKSSIRDAFAPCSGVRSSKNFNHVTNTPTHSTSKHRYEYECTGVAEELRRWLVHDCRRLKGQLTVIRMVA